MTEVTPEKILERAKFLHIDMLAMQIYIRQNVYRRLFRDDKLEEGEKQYLITLKLHEIYFERQAKNHKQP